jgi:cytochrome b6-f complex iron-sulfur subunit
MKADPQTRRQFCARTCSAAAVAALGTAFAGVLQGCGGGGSPTSPGGGVSAASLPQVTGAASGGSITVSVDGTALAPVGSLALVRSSIGDVLVARTGTETFSAVSSACTHQACEITAYSGQAFVCPCHGSQFDASGRVLAGPARTSLRQYTTQFASGVLTISA